LRKPSSILAISELLKNNGLDSVVGIECSLDSVIEKLNKIHLTTPQDREGIQVTAYRKGECEYDIDIEIDFFFEKGKVYITSFKKVKFNKRIKCHSLKFHFSQKQMEKAKNNYKKLIEGYTDFFFSGEEMTPIWGE
jgi:hypothetical protein